ncbi:hypothetical protein [Streptomyces sp. NPDC058545]|uniref:hypothetical protein n=1 Tax=Streptomyces sp. NPDC058545 TaxID=3346544 RepID=UPI00364B14C4
MKAQLVRGPGERRTPEITREHDDSLAAEQRAGPRVVLVSANPWPPGWMRC